MKVIIIGAGIAGLTCALACQRVGIEVKIYDKAKALRNIGGGILIWPHGIRYLEWLGLSDALKPFWTDVTGCEVFGHEGTEIFSEGYADFYSLVGGKILPIDRRLFQQALVNQLLPDTLILNKSCQAIKNESHQGSVIFEDGTIEVADIVVGADGIYSTTRKNFRSSTSLQYTNHCWWGGVIEQKYVPNLSADKVFMALGVGKICIVWPTCDERFMWYLPVKMPLADFRKTDGGKMQLQSICAGWSKEVEQIINAPASAQSFNLAIYAVPAEAPWANDRMVLIGDAAHTLGPILGQGASQAIEDAFVLVNCLQNSSHEIPVLLKHYETLRATKYQRLSELENQTASVMINDDAETLSAFQKQLQQIDLVTMYQDLIPLVNEQACIQTLSMTKMG